MSKKVLAIVSSPRKNGNTELLADEFVKGAREARHEAEKLCLREKKIAPCLAGGAQLKNKEFYFITTAADAPHAMERTMADLQGFVDCVPGSVVKGKVYGQAFGVGEIKGRPAMQEAYTFGKNC